MRFLVTDIGNEDILLRYPWLATFKPKFGWKDAIIETQALPIIISSTHPVESRLVIARMQSHEEKEEIVHQLEETTTIRGIATELAIQAGEGKRKVEIPAVYDHFKQLFSEEASQRFPPSCPWDHAIELKLLRFGLHSYADTSDCIVSFFLSLTLKPMYDMISHLSHVQYDLTSLSCTI